VPRTAPSATLLTIPLDPAAPALLFRQRYDGLRQAILGGRLLPGTRLPATRGLARDLGVSRNTVLNAYEQLLTEGYLEGKA
jgi:GntR family transcriptional regulator / MocR family aminotransferase